MREQEVRELYEAYLQVHQPQEEVEQLDENIQGALEAGAKFMQTNPVGKAIGAVLSPVGSGRKTPTKGSGGYRPVVKSVANEETDLFDTILEHLVAEGYADTNEAALAIMANMSEEWRESIVEQTAAIRANVPQPGTRTARMSATGKEPAGDRLVRQAGQAIGKFLGSRGVQKIEPAPPQRKPLVSTTKPGPSNNFGRGF